MLTTAFPTEELERASTVLSSLYGPHRLNLIRLLHEHSSLSVQRMYETLKLPQAIVSQQLKVLRDAGVVTTKREGKYIFYSLNYPLLKRIAEALKPFAKS